MNDKGKIAIIILGVAGCAFLLCAAGGVLIVVGIGASQSTPTSEPTMDLEPYETGEVEEDYEDWGDDAPSEPLSDLTVSNFRFTDPDGNSHGADFAEGEIVHYAYDITGLARDDSDQWNLRMDLTVIAPDGSLVLSDQTMVDQTGSLPDPLPLTGYVELNPGSPPGAYTVRTVTVDQMSGETVIEEHTFEVR